jgi:DegV family protein with EDD domain
MPIAVVADSTCDIPADIAERLKIQIVPNVLVIEGREYLDGQEITRQEFYERLPRMRSIPTTAAPSAGTYQLLYENLFHQGYQQIISLHAPSALSGIYNAATLAAKPFDGRVIVIDSGMITLGLGYQAMAAAEAAAQGHTLTKIITEIESVRQRLHVIAMLDTLEYVRRGGRVSWTRARLGSLLDIKPFLEVRDGKVLRLGESRTRRRGIERLHQIIQNLGPLEKLAVLHTDAEEDALQILEQVKKNFNIIPLLVNVTTVIGTHVGPNGLGFAAVTR